MTAFESFVCSSSKKNVSKLKLDNCIFDAYKKVIEENASEILVFDENKIVMKFSKNEVLKSVLNLPIDTKLKDVTLKK